MEGTSLKMPRGWEARGEPPVGLNEGISGFLFQLNLEVGTELEKLVVLAAWAKRSRILCG